MKGKIEMKVLIIRPTPNKVNLKTYNLQEVGLAKALVRKGHECDVMYYCGNEKDHYEEISFGSNLKFGILWMHGYGALYEGIYPSLSKYIKNYDIIQIGGYIGITSLWLNIFAKNKIINYQGNYYFAENRGNVLKDSIWDLVLLPFLNKKNMIVVTKSVLAADYIKKKGIRDVTTIGVGLDVDNLNVENQQLEKNQFINMIEKSKEKNKHILYIGALEKRRNILFIIETLKEIVSTRDDIKLIIVGKGEKEYVKNCFDLINKYKLKDRIMYQEKLEQKYIKALYENSDIFILPTRYEIFGMVILEAMYFKLPVITTYNGGSSTLFDGGNGIIIDNLDSHQWSRQIISLLSNKNAANVIGENAHNTIANNYTWDALAEKFLSVYVRRLKCQ